MKTTFVQVVCRQCQHPYRTRVRGGSTRCPKCRTTRYVRKDQEWEGEVPAALSGAAARAEEMAARKPVWVTCREGHSWQSRARDMTSVRCPECGAGTRVPRRTHYNTHPAPPWEVPVPAPAPAKRPARPPARPRAYDPEPAPVPSWPRPLVPPRPLAPAPLPAPSGGLLGLLAARIRPGREESVTAPAAPVPAPAPQPARRRPAVAVPGTSRPVLDEEKDRRRRDAVCQIVRSLATSSSSLMVWYDTPPGLCEVLDPTLPRDRQRCPATVTHGVRFYRDATEADAFTCGEHAGPLATIAARAEYITAVPYRIR